MNSRQVRWILMASVAVGLAAVIGWLFLPRPVEVELATARRGPILEVVADQGLARVREAYVVAAPSSGRLRRIELEVGDRVVSGRTVVARIDPLAADLLDPRARAQGEAAIATAEAGVSAAQAEAERRGTEAKRADVELGRVRTLADRGFAPAEALDEAIAAADASRAALRAAEAEIGARRSEVAKARSALLGPEARAGRPVSVAAPVSGYVTRVLQESARAVSVGEPLLEIADGGGLEAAVEFLSQDAVRIKEGMSAELFDWGGAGVIPAIVRRVEPRGFTKISALGVEEQRVLVLLQLTGSKDAWRNLGPGYRVWGRVFLRREKDVLKIPLGALVRKDAGWAVFRLERGGARLTPVEVDILTDREANIASGLKDGDQVIVFPSDRVAEGVKVRERAER